MGTPLSKKDAKNGITKEAAVTNETDFNHSKANDLTGNLNNTPNTSQGLGPSQLINRQMEPSNGDEAMPTRMDQVPAVEVPAVEVPAVDVPAVDAPENREQSIHMAMNISLDADPVKHIPYLVSSVKEIQEHKTPEKSTDKKNSTPVLQQATPAGPTAGPCCGVKTAVKTAEKFVGPADYGNISSCMQKVNIKAVAPHVPAVERKPTASPNNVATQKQTTAAADTNVKLRLQGELKVSLQDTSCKPKKKCSTKASNQNQSKNNTGNIIMKGERNGKNGQAEKQEQEPAINPPVTPENKVRTEGRWPNFTVNQSCSSKACCKHNPGTGLPQNVSKWVADYKCEPPWIPTVRRSV
ncbi:uncharacterized protein LOC120792575 [Xiphias gladius]|uniref:uncharacterized protein LOC120792575 n=1 Tax=Xiphias gladius TaxID=8245 RepID=UPI001A984958|nr:uncharacterized protein LOC120792575 [Xiphias gladius]XP_039987779.1 uncharacterized protein LOC120792575 [Xiphias gladius]XP_039987780.1 uncharacterized protein LOC120792575 [Xiphias gladius]